MADPEIDPDAEHQTDFSSPSPYDWIPDHWRTDSAAAPQVDDVSAAPPPVTDPVMMDPTPEALPPGALGPSMPPQTPQTPQPGLFDGTFFDPGSTDAAAGGAADASLAPSPPLHPADAAALGIPPEVHPADAAGADLPPLPAPAEPAPAAPVPYGATAVPYGAIPNPYSQESAPGAVSQQGTPPPVVLGPSLPAPPPQPVQTPYGWDPLSGTLFESKHIDPNAANPFEGVSPATGYADAEELARRDPATLLQLQIDQSTRKALKESADRLRADEEDVAQLKFNQSVRQAADAKTQRDSDQIVADAQKLAQTPLDRGRWFRNKSTLGKITTVLAAVVGGLMSKPGGPNLGIEYLDKHIDDDIADQKADIENKRGGLAARQTAVAQEFARTGNLFQAAETVRLAVKQAAINKLQTEQQNFDPRGTGYLDYGKAIQTAGAGLAQQIEQNRKTMFAENVQTIKLQMEAERDAETRRKNQADEALARQKAAQAGAGKTKETVYTPEQLQILNPSATSVPKIGMTQADFTKWQSTQKGGEELATAKRANDPETLARAQQVPGITTEDGVPLSFLPDEVKDIKKALFNATELNRMNDELTGLISKHGFDPGWSKSDYYQKAQEIFSSMVLLSKEQDHLGALSGGDVEIEHKKVGTDDPTQLRDTLAGLASFRHQTTEGINSLVQTHAIVPSGKHIKRWDPPPLITSVPESAKLTGKTLAEHVDEAKPSKLTKALQIPGIRKGLSALPGYAEPEDYQSNAANIPVGPTGLAVEDTAKVGGAIQAYSTAPPQAQNAIVDQLKVWANSDRPSVTTGVLGLIQGENPALYERVLSQLPEAVQKQRREFDAVRARFPGANLPPPPAPKRKADSPKDDE